MDPKDKNLIERGIDAVKGIFKGPDSGKPATPAASGGADPAAAPASSPRAPERSDRKLDEITDTLQEMNDAISTLARAQGEAYRDAAKGIEERFQKNLETLKDSQRDLLQEIRRSQELQNERLEHLVSSTRANLRLMLFFMFFFLAGLGFFFLLLLRLSKTIPQ